MDYLYSNSRMDYDLEELVKKVECLPTLKPVAAKIVGLCSNPQTPIPKFIEVLSADQSMSTQILRVANSSYFTYPQKITSIEKSIGVLGFDMTRDIVLSIALFGHHQRVDTKPDFDLQSLWDHAYLTALIGKALADIYDPEKREILFLAGLFHDIGKLVQNQIIKKDYPLVFIKSQRENEKLHIIERKILGFHHGEVGGALLQHWNLPDILTKMVKYHHYPFEFTGNDDENMMIRFCYLSNLLAHFVQNGFQNFEDLCKLDRNITRYFGFKNSEFDEIMNFTRTFISNHKSLSQILMES